MTEREKQDDAKRQESMNYLIPKDLVSVAWTGDPKLDFVIYNEWRIAHGRSILNN
jgi:hypothetical protein